MVTIRLPQALFLGCSVFAGCFSLAAHAASAGPAGAVYDSSTMAVSRSGTVTTVTQSAPRGVVDWASFDVARQESVVFAQPDAQSATLNRVHSATASAIDGAISANGRVIIQNGNGVVFGSNARIDVGSLVATTLNVDERSFLDSGRLVLNGSGDSSAQVRNSGRIKVADGGFVALLGGSVANDGLIQARLGSVTLGAGSAATIDFTGDGMVQVAITDPVTHKATEAGALVANSGIISADGGNVVLSARTARDVMALAINLDGVVEARSIGTSAGKVSLLADGGQVQLGAASRIDASGIGGASGGQVAITGTSVNLAGGARIDAHGEGAGGTILVGGDYRGQGTLAHAHDVTVASGALLDASGVGGGGKVVVWSDGATHFDGQVLAGATGKNAAGGLVETSSSGLLDIGANASVSTYSALGRTGAWLLDPTSLAIVASGGSASTPDEANGAVGLSSINASTVVSALASNSVQLVADNLITVDAPIVATTLAGSPNGLELITTGPDSEIHVNAPILLQNGNLALRAEGNILLGTVGSTETDFTRRAIIATGSGTLWMQTRSTGSIIQADNSAILAENIGAIGGTVSLGSWDNFTLNLAGSARSGTFLFRETNASNTSPVGIVVDPFTLQTLSGVEQTTTDLLQTQEFTSTTAPTGPVDEVLNLALTGAQAGQTFDTLVFSALPYQPLPGNSNQPDPSLTDSSDYGVRSLTYSIGGSAYTVAPETTAANRPAGFALAAAGGSVVTWTNPVYTTAAWGVEGFSGVGGTDPEEIGYHPQQSISENLIASLGGATSSVTAALRLFFAPDFGVQFAEAAQVQFYRTTTTPGTVQIRQASLSGTPNPVSREYGDANPAFSFQGSGPTFLGVDQYVASQISGYELPLPTISTSATPTSPVGAYPLVVTPPPTSGFVYDRYTYDFSNGTLTVIPAPLSIVSDNFLKTYGDADPELTFGVTGLKNGESAATVLSGAQGRTAGENVGHYPTNIGSLAANTNYTIVSYTPGNLEIVPRPLTLLADSDSRVYGDTNPGWIAAGQNSHFTLTGFVNNDQTRTNLSSVDFATTANVLSSVGAYAITPSNGVLTGAAAGNYILTYADGSLLIDPAQLTVAANNQSRLFGEANPTLTATTTGWKNGDQVSNTMVASLSTPATELSNVGTYAITVDSAAISGPAAGNYVIVR
ncbi:filamentous hemagglutinin family protein, partial [Novosphingobium sp. PhB165]